MIPTVRSSFDVALWLWGRMHAAREPFNAMKLQNILYLAQAAWSIQHDGAKLMPATFLATRAGPIEPTIYHAFENGAPRLRVRPPSPDVELFLQALWDCFGGQGADVLAQIASEDSNYRRTIARERNSEIIFDATEEVPPVEAGQPAVANLTTTSGKRAKKWLPGQARSGGQPRNRGADPFADDPGNPATKFTLRRPGG